MEKYYQIEELSQMPNKEIMQTVAGLLDLFKIANYTD